MATTRNSSQGILADDHTAQREEIIGLLTTGYWMELETVMSYISNSINPDGVRAQEIIESLKADVQEELGHAQQRHLPGLEPSAPRTGPSSGGLLSLHPYVDPLG